MKKDPIPVLWVSGPSGAGKTAAAWEIYRQLVATGIETAYVDIDQLGICYPAPDSDPDRYATKTRNVAALVTSFKASGARCVVISGVIDPERGVSSGDFTGAFVTVCWLDASEAELRRRFLARGNSPEEVDELVRLSAIDLNPRISPELVVDATSLSVTETAAVVRERAGNWPSLPATHLVKESSASGDDVSPDGPILLLYGATGVGKSTVGFDVYLSVLRTGITAAYVDIGQLGFRSPTPADHQLKARNLASVWRTYREVGAEALIAVGQIEDAPTIRLYENALPNAIITWCRLHATEDRLRQRILDRGAGRGSWPEPGDALKGRPTEELLAIARDATVTADALERIALGMRVDVTDRTVDEAAQEILARWTSTP